MRISVLVVILTLCVVARGWATFIQPIALSIGAVFAALNINHDLISDLQPTAFRNFFSKEETAEDENNFFVDHEAAEEKSDVDKDAVYDEEW